MDNELLQKMLEVRDEDGELLSDQALLVRAKGALLFSCFPDSFEIQKQLFGLQTGTIFKTGGKSFFWEISKLNFVHRKLGFD